MGFIENNHDYVINRLEGEAEVTYVDASQSSAKIEKNSTSSGTNKFKDIFDD